MLRLYYFDNIKILLIIFVILIHSGLAYIPNAEGWSPSYLAITLCFLISNYIARRIPYADRVIF